MNNTLYLFLNSKLWLLSFACVFCSFVKCDTACVTISNEYLYNFCQTRTYFDWISISHFRRLHYCPFRYVSHLLRTELEVVNKDMMGIFPWLQARFSPTLPYSVTAVVSCKTGGCELNVPSECGVTPSPPTRRKHNSNVCSR